MIGFGRVDRRVVFQRLLVFARVVTSGPKTGETRANGMIPRYMFVESELILEVFVAAVD